MTAPTDAEIETRVNEIIVKWYRLSVPSGLRTSSPSSWATN